MQTQEKKTILILTIDAEVGRNVQSLGTLYSAVCLSKNLVWDITANFRNWTVGGELKMYTTMVNEGIALVIERLKDQAREVSADAIYGLRFSTTSVAQGAAELIGYGTAVKYVD